MSITANFAAGLVAVAAVYATASAAAEEHSTDALRIDAARLQQTLEDLSAFGLPAGGSFACGSIHCYIELHIEQGGILDKSSIPIGVVDGIVSIDEYEVEIKGFANHAGTTPMPERRNALLAAARLIQGVQDEVTMLPGRQVGTVGQLNVFPNAPNVVPGRVTHTVEFRDLSGDTLTRLGEGARKRARKIATETGTDITLTQVEHLRPALDRT